MTMTRIELFPGAPLVRSQWVLTLTVSEASSEAQEHSPVMELVSGKAWIWTHILHITGPFQL